MSRLPRTEIVRAWMQRGALSVALGLVLTITVANSASADAGQAPPVFKWIEIKDSRGLSAWVYEMSLDRGGITAPDKFFWSAVVDFCWSLYWSGVVLAIWFLDWVLSFEWVKLIAAPLITIGDALQDVVDRFGLVPTLLTVTAFVAVLLMARGRWATGIWDLVVALVIAALASGVLAQPLRLVAGNDGLIYTARNWGFELAAAMSGSKTGESLDAAAMRQKLTGQMVDTFVRQPAQMINFGQVLDGGRCEAAYNEILKGGPYGLEPTIRQAVGICDNALGDYAAQPAAGMATGAFLFAPAALVILLLAVVIAGTVLLAGVTVLWQGLKVIVNLVLGLLPGGARGSLLLTITEAAMSLILLAFSTIFLAVFMDIVRSLFAGAAGNQVARAFVITDIVLVLGLLIFIKAKKRLQAAAHRLAGLLGQRPGVGARPTRIPEPVGSGLAATAGRAAGLGLSLAYLGRTLKPAAQAAPRAVPVPVGPGPSERTVFTGTAGRPAPPTPTPGGATATPAPPSGSGPTGAPLVGRSTPSTVPTSASSSESAPALDPAESSETAEVPSGGQPAARRPARIGGGLARIAARKVVSGTLKLGAKAGLAYLSGGASTALSAAIGAAKARRVARLAGQVPRLPLTRRLAPGSGVQPSPPTPPPPPSPAADVSLPKPTGARPPRPTSRRGSAQTAAAADPAGSAWTATPSPTPPAAASSAGSPAQSASTPAGQRDGTQPGGRVTRRRGPTTTSPTPRPTDTDDSDGSASRSGRAVGRPGAARAARRGSHPGRR